MKAAVVTDGGLEVREVLMPRPKANEILVRVRAASLNRADLAVAAGHQHGAIGGPGAIPGLEWAGEITEVGAEVQGLRRRAERIAGMIRTMSSLGAAAGSAAGTVYTGIRALIAM